MFQQVMLPLFLLYQRFLHVVQICSGVGALFMETCIAPAHEVLDRHSEQPQCAQAGKQFQFALFRIVADLAAMAEAPRLRVPAASSRTCCQAA